jgi:hypothetical protein
MKCVTALYEHNKEQTKNKIKKKLNSENKVPENSEILKNS